MSEKEEFISKLINQLDEWVETTEKKSLESHESIDSFAQLIIRNSYLKVKDFILKEQMESK